MSQDRQAAVGAFVLGGIVLGLSAIVLFGKFNLFNASTRAAIVFEDSIAGLSVGSQVTFRGVRVGAVESVGIEFDPKTKVAYIPVTVELKPGRAVIGRKRGESVDVADLVTRGMRAELKVQSFVTGQSEIELDFDPSSVAVLHGDVTSLPEIPTRRSPFQRATEQLTQLPLRELADNAIATLKSLRRLTDNLDGDLPHIVDSAEVTLDRAGQTAETAGQAIKALQGRVDTTLSAIERAGNSADQQLNQRGADLHTVLIATDQTVHQVHDLLGDVKSITSDRSPARMNLEATLRDLAAASASLRGLANDVEHNPQLLLTGRKP